MTLRYTVGADLAVSENLFSETPGRVLVAVKPEDAEQLTALSNKFNITIAKLGTTGGDDLIINDAVIPLSELSQAHSETFPKLFG